MNFKLISSVVLFTIVGAVSYCFFINSAIEPVPTESKQVVSYFEKNQKCFDSKSFVEQEIRLVNDENWNERFIEIFYSPKHDSCLYITEINSDTWKPLKRLMDYKTVAGGEPIDFCEYVSSDIIYEIELDKRREMKMNTEMIESTYENVLRDNCVRFDEFVKQLKNIK